MTLTTRDLTLIFDPQPFIGGRSNPNTWVSDWRYWLKDKLYTERQRRSDLSFRLLGDSAEMHEGIFPRSRVPGGVDWHWRIYSGVNCFLLLPEEHQPAPPSPATCYWISVARYGPRRVNAWIDALPFRSTLDMSWKGTLGRDIIYQIPEKYPVDPTFYMFYRLPKIWERINQYA
ncbi:MAG TPA: hypothetical protein PKD55_00345 [Bellilinea sp.]|nr:hypothetical protein [Bellilinea sp.]